ncbi:hypothetical protein RUND412_011028 [Rhizina undulata]
MEADDRELLKHPHVYAITDQWDIPNLKNNYTMHFKEQLSSQWMSDTFVDAGIELYSLTLPSDHLMRDLVTMSAYSHIYSLYQKEEFRDVVRENTEFALDLIKLWVTGRF